MQSPEAALDRAIEEAEAAWPDLHVDTRAFRTSLRSRLEECGSRDGALGSLHLGDLFLAFACAQGNPQALEIVLQQYLPNPEPIASRFGESVQVVLDAIAQVEQTVLVRNEIAPASILDYSGRGTLRSWLRAAVIHAVMNEQREARRRRGREHQAADLPDRVSLVGPELLLMKGEAGELVRAGLKEALSVLSPRERTILRMHLLDRLSIDEIGAAYGIHRATAARTISRARESLRAATRDWLRERLKSTETEVESLMRQFSGEFDCTLSTYLREGSSPTV